MSRAPGAMLIIRGLNMRKTSRAANQPDCDKQFCEETPGRCSLCRLNSKAKPQVRTRHRRFRKHKLNYSKTTRTSRCAFSTGVLRDVRTSVNGNSTGVNFPKSGIAHLPWCAKVCHMQSSFEHSTQSSGRAVMSAVFAMQCMNAAAGLLAQNPMSRRNDAYTAIYYFRYC